MENGKLEVGDRGLTLIETILAIVIISIALTAFMTLYATGMRDSATPELVVTATNLAQQKMDEVAGIKRASGYAAVVDSTDSVTVNSITFNRYICATEVLSTALDPAESNLCSNPCSADTGAGSGYKRVTVAVCWNGGNDSVMVKDLFTNY